MNLRVYFVLLLFAFNTSKKEWRHSQQADRPASQQLIGWVAGWLAGWLGWLQAGCLFCRLADSENRRKTICKIRHLDMFDC